MELNETKKQISHIMGNCPALEDIHKIFVEYLDYDPFDHTIANLLPPEFIKKTIFSKITAEKGYFKVIFCKLKKISKDEQLFFLASTIQHYPENITIFTDSDESCYIFFNAGFNKKSMELKHFRSITFDRNADPFKIADFLCSLSTAPCSKLADLFKRHQQAFDTCDLVRIMTF